MLCGITNIKTMYKTNRFQLDVRVYSDNAQRLSKCGHSITYLFLPCFDVICALSVGTHAQQNGTSNIVIC